MLGKHEKKTTVIPCELNNWTVCEKCNNCLHAISRHFSSGFCDRFMHSYF